MTQGSAKSRRRAGRRQEPGSGEESKGVTTRPGLAKAKRPPLLQSRVVELWRSTDYGWHEAFRRADVMSEGSVRTETQGPVYYGSTSLLLPLVSCGGCIPDAKAQQILRVLSGDPHARLRAVRVACLEAQLRANGRLGRVMAETSIHADHMGLRIDVEVEAPLVRGKRSQDKEDGPDETYSARSLAPRRK